MVAVLQLLLSDQPPEVPRKAGLGDRFHYFRGASGRRYLFSEVPAKDIANFASAVAAVAERLPDGRLTATWIATLDRFGNPAMGDRRGPRVRPGTVVLIHLLSASDAERQALVADLLASSIGSATAPSKPSALALAA
jgi:hypothetical protein